jgi:hypothetical protein
MHSDMAITPFSVWYLKGHGRMVTLLAALYYMMSSGMNVRVDSFLACRDM